MKNFDSLLLEVARKARLAAVKMGGGFFVVNLF